MKTWWVVTSLLVSAPAFAQEPYTVAAAQPADTGPEVLPNLLSTRAGTTIDISASYVDLDGLSDVNLFAFKAHGQYVMPGGMGGYVMVPVASISGDGVDSDTQLGNVEVGGLYSMKQGPNMDVMFRGGVSIDTQGEAMNELDFLNVFALYIPHPTDAFTAGGLNTTWGRGQAQVVNTSGTIKFGGMIGVDVPIAGDVADADNLSLLINAAASVGYHDPKFGVAGGFTFIQSVSDGDDDNIKHVFFSGNMAINPATRITAGIALPLDGDMFIDGTAFTLGVRAGM